jgi:hypothetical protein
MPMRLGVFEFWSYSVEIPKLNKRLDIYGKAAKLLLVLFSFSFSYGVFS